MKLFEPIGAILFGVATVSMVLDHMQHESNKKPATEQVATPPAQAAEPVEPKTYYIPVDTTNLSVVLQQVKAGDKVVFTQANAPSVDVVPITVAAPATPPGSQYVEPSPTDTQQQKIKDAVKKILESANPRENQQ